MEERQRLKLELKRARKALRVNSQKIALAQLETMENFEFNAIIDAATNIWRNRKHG